MKIKIMLAIVLAPALTQADFVASYGKFLLSV